MNTSVVEPLDVFGEVGRFEGGKLDLAIVFFIFTVKGFVKKWR